MRGLVAKFPLKCLYICDSSEIFHSVFSYSLNLTNCQTLRSLCQLQIGGEFSQEFLLLDWRFTFPKKTPTLSFC